jgi:hypothetical protein
LFFFSPVSCMNTGPILLSNISPEARLLFTVLRFTPRYSAAFNCEENFPITFLLESSITTGRPWRVLIPFLLFESSGSFAQTSFILVLIASHFSFEIVLYSPRWESLIFLRVSADSTLDSLVPTKEEIFYFLRLFIPSLIFFISFSPSLVK